MVLFLTGVILGTVISTIVYKSQPAVGTLRIDSSNPEKDVYRFDIDDFESLSKRKRLILNVDTSADLSQK
jgi:hypothetical protein